MLIICVRQLNDRIDIFFSPNLLDITCKSPLILDNSFLIVSRSSGPSFNSVKILYEAKICPKIPFKYSSISAKAIDNLHSHSKSLGIFNQINNRILLNFLSLNCQQPHVCRCKVNHV